jgi:hypothetical protein
MENIIIPGYAPHIPIERTFRTNLGLLDPVFALLHETSVDFLPDRIRGFGPPFGELLVVLFVSTDSR